MRTLTPSRTITRTRYRGKFEVYVVDVEDGFHTIYAQTPSSYMHEPTPDELIGECHGVDAFNKIIEEREAALLVKGEGSYVEVVSELAERLWAQWPRLTTEEHKTLRTLHDKYHGTDAEEGFRLAYRAGMDSGVIEMSVLANNRDEGHGLNHDYGDDND